VHRPAPAFRADYDVLVHARRKKVDRERHADRGEDRGEGRPSEETALEGDREEGELHEGHRDEDRRPVRGWVRGSGLDLRLAGEERDRREDADDAEDDAGCQRASTSRSSTRLKNAAAMRTSGP